MDGFLEAYPSVHAISQVHTIFGAICLPAERTITGRLPRPLITNGLTLPIRYLADTLWVSAGG